MMSRIQKRLLQVARQSIHEGLLTGEPDVPDPGLDEASLLEPGASFVTLTIENHLRGCIGSLQAGRPLLVDVAENAFSAAFRDPRFNSLKADEFPRLHICIALLGNPELLPVSSEQDLCAQLRPGVDGLILSDGERRATFLPSVWSQLNSPEAFVRRLKEKGGWPTDYWGPEIICERYTVETFEE
jgi:AmmeMemoRadiSam system protein A